MLVEALRYAKDLMGVESWWEYPGMRNRCWVLDPSNGEWMDRTLVTMSESNVVYDTYRATCSLDNRHPDIRHSASCIK